MKESQAGHTGLGERLCKCDDPHMTSSLDLYFVILPVSCKSHPSPIATLYDCLLTLCKLNASAKLVF